MMAEMTASEAIAALHNNQYQKHIGNGEYDYIHPLTDAACKGIESLIQQQQQTIEAMKCCGNCRYWHLLAQDGEVIKYCEWNHKENFAFRTDICKRWKPM